MKIDLNSLRPDHPNYGCAAPAPEATAGGPKAYTGDFTSKSFDGAKHLGLIFPDGNYTLPPDLKAAALEVAKFLFDKEPGNLKELLPNVGLRDGEPSLEHTASYLLALAVDTYRPYNLDRVLNPRKFGPPREVESKFKNFFDTGTPLDEAGVAVARQFYGDNYDKSIGTTNPSDDHAFARLMQKILPPPRKGN